MKKSILFLSLIIVHFALSAQDATKSLSVEAFGAHNVLGGNYDARLKDNFGWGYRVGIGWSYGSSEIFGINVEKNTGVTVPLEVNYLTGRKNHHLELGAGASLGYYHQDLNSLVFDLNTGDVYEYRHKENKFGYFFFGDIGYRYQRPSGIMFRAGVSPSFNFGDRHGVSKDWCYPYIGLGWTFSGKGLAR